MENAQFRKLNLLNQQSSCVVCSVFIVVGVRVPFVIFCCFVSFKKCIHGHITCQILLNDVKTTLPFSEEDGEHYEPFKVFHISVFVSGCWLLALDFTKVHRNFEFNFLISFLLSLLQRLVSVIIARRHFLLNYFLAVSLGST